VDLGWLSLSGRASLTPPSCPLVIRVQYKMTRPVSTKRTSDSFCSPSMFNPHHPSPVSEAFSMDDGDATNLAIRAIRRVGRHVSTLFGFSQSTNRSRWSRGVMCSSLLPSVHQPVVLCLLVTLAPSLCSRRNRCPSVRLPSVLHQRPTGRSTRLVPMWVRVWVGVRICVSSRYLLYTSPLWPPPPSHRSWSVVYTNLFG
jgi:hypothetical protein